MKIFLFVNPSMVKPFRLLTYRGGGRGSLPPLNLNHCCLTFCLLLTYIPILGLPEYKLKVVNILEMHGTRDGEVVVFNLTESNTAKIGKKIQERALRLVLDDYISDYSTLLKRSGTDALKNKNKSKHWLLRSIKQIYEESLQIE